MIKAIGCYITDIDLSKCENLDILVLEHNELKGLDLTPNTKLSAIYLSDNPKRGDSDYNRYTKAQSSDS